MKQDSSGVPADDGQKIRVASTGSSGICHIVPAHTMPSSITACNAQATPSRGVPPGTPLASSESTRGHSPTSSAAVEECMGEKQREPRSRNEDAETDDRKQGLPATYTSDAHLPSPPRDLPRTATEMAPGIPAGSGKGIDEALRQPDSDIGGGVAGDTTPEPDRAVSRRSSEGEGQGRKSEDVRSDDRDRTTL